MLSGLTPADIESFRELGQELECRLESGDRLYLVPAYTGKARLEITPENLATVHRLLQLFPGARFERWQNAALKPAPYPGGALSYSRINTLEQCPLKFRRRYVDKVSVPEIDGSAAIGKLVHSTIETVTRFFVDHELKGTIDVAMAEATYEAQWASSSLTGQESFTDGLKLVRRWVHCTERIDYRDILAVEKRFELTIGDELLVGYIDLVRWVDDETIEVVDYKTNRVPYSAGELDSNLQASIYAMAARALWPWAKRVRLSFAMLRHGYSQHTERSVEQLRAAAGYIRAVGAELRSRNEWPAKLNPYCAWCDYRRTCPAYAAALSGTLDVPTGDADGLKAVALELEAIKAQARLLDGRKKELEAPLKAAAKELGDVDLGPELPIYTYHPVRYLTYPVQTTLQKLAEATSETVDAWAERVTTVDKKGLQSAVKSLELGSESDRLVLLAELEAAATERHTRRFYARKR